MLKTMVGNKLVIVPEEIDKNQPGVLQVYGGDKSWFSSVHSYPKQTCVKLVRM